MKNLTTSAIEDNKRIALNNAKRDGYIISPILNYPVDGKALNCYTDYPCKIEKGRDEFPKKDRWYVMFDYNIHIEDKDFSNIGQALSYMKESYYKYLKEQIKKIDKGILR